MKKALILILALVCLSVAAVGCGTKKNTIHEGPIPPGYSESDIKG